MLQRIKEWSQTCPPTPAEPWKTHHSTRRRQAKWFGAGITSVRWLENIVTAMDAFSCYLFAFSTSNRDDKTIVKIIISVMTKHAYLPTTLISDKGPAFVSHVIKEVAGVIGITLKHATTKHAQTIGKFKWSHASIKQTLNIETSERRSLWQKYVIRAVLNYNTPYHAILGFKPSRAFQGRILYIVLDIKWGICLQQAPFPTSQNAQDVLAQTEAIHQDIQKNAMQAYIKHNHYFYKKANASLIKQADYVYILQPETDHQGKILLCKDQAVFYWNGTAEHQIFGMKN